MAKPGFLRKAGASSVETSDYNELVDVVAELSGLPVGGPTALTDLTDVTGTTGPNKSPVWDGIEFPLTEITTREDLDAILVSVAHVDWHDIGAPGEPQFLSGFSNVGDPWAAARYRLALNSTVYIEGLIVHQGLLGSEDAPLPVFQLPPACAPGGDLMFISPSGGLSISTTHVRSDGLVQWGGYITVGEGAEVFISLSNIVFSVEQAATP